MQEEIIYFGYANGYLTKVTQYAWSTCVEQKMDGEWVEVYPSIKDLDVTDVNCVKFKVLAGMGGDPDAGKLITWATRPAIKL
jgi:hypothetical protein